MRHERDYIAISIIQFLIEEKIIAPLRSDSGYMAAESGPSLKTLLMMLMAI